MNVNLIVQLLSINGTETAISNAKNYVLHVSNVLDTLYMKTGVVYFIRNIVPDPL